MLMPFLEASPVLATILVLTLRRGRMLEAGLVGLVLAGALLLWAPSPAGGKIALLLGAAGRGLWLAWHAIAVILAGLLFHQVVSAGTAAGETLATYDHRRLWAACFLLGPFFEAATGFGVGVVILVPVLRRLSIPAAALVPFALFSQILVPWGALAIGTMLGAELAGLDPAALGTASAWLSGPLLALYLAAFWILAAATGHRPAPAAMLDDILWTALLWLLLLGANRAIGVEIAGLVACGGLLPLRWWRDTRPRRGDWRRLARHAAPYAALALVLSVMRGVPVVSATMRGLWIWRPAGDLAPFAPFHHVAFWLAVTAIAGGMAYRLPATAWRRLLGAWGRAAARPVAVTAVFLVMAEIMADSGASQHLAAALAAVLGAGALAASPLFAAVAGFLTGSNVASNALLMPLQKALAARLGADLMGIAALQNVACSNFTLLSPMRVAMGCALIGDAAQAQAAAAAVYRQLAPLALALLALLGTLGVILG